MKYSFLFLIIILNACSSPDHIQSENSVDKILLLSRLEMMKGNWVSVDYLEALKNSKSPLKIMDNAGVIILEISPSLIICDSLQVGIADLHEGGSFSLYLKQGFSENSLALHTSGYEWNDFESDLALEISGKDTFIYIENYNQNGKIKDKFKFKKSYFAKDALKCFENEVNKTLISGDYILNDTARVEFISSGEISGLNNYSQYYISTDYVINENPADQIELSEKDSKSMKYYNFLFNQNTLIIFDDLYSSPKNIKYKLVKLN